MYYRLNSFWFILGASILLVSGLGGLMLWKDSGQKSEPLVLYCAAALSEPIKEIVPLYEQQTGIRIEIHYGKSEEMLTGIKTANQGDLFLPADDSYIDKAQTDGLLGDVLPLVRMNAVVVVNAKANRSIHSWEGLFKDADAKFAIASEGAAVREVTKKHLSDAQWKQLVDRSVSLGTVTDVANAIKLGGAVNAGIVWDALVASPKYQGLEIVKLKEMDGIVANVSIGVVKSSLHYDEALAFAKFVSSHCADIFQKNGFTPIGSGWEHAP